MSSLLVPENLFGSGHLEFSSGYLWAHFYQRLFFPKGHFCTGWKSLRIQHCLLVCSLKCDNWNQMRSSRNSHSCYKTLLIALQAEWKKQCYSLKLVIAVTQVSEPKLVFPCVQMKVHGKRNQNTKHHNTNNSETYRMHFYHKHLPDY